MTPLAELGVVLVATAVVGAVADRLGQSVIPAYIVAGIVLGPGAPTDLLGVHVAFITDATFVHVLADLGVVLLLFFLGLHVDARRLADDWDRVVGAGVVDFACNYAVGLALGWLFGFSLLETLFLAGVVYISSSAIVTKALLDRGWIANRESEPILGALVFEDIVIAVYLTILSTLALDGGSLGGALLTLLEGFGVLAAVAAAGWYATGAVERALAVTDDELFVLRVLGVTVCVASAAAALGVSKGIAAFFVGASLGATDYEERIERTLAPARDCFSAVFFFAIGLTTSVTALSSVAGLLAVALVATTASKLVSGVVGGRLYGLDDRRSLRVGLSMVARGEFSLVLAALATSSSAPIDGIPAFAVGYVLVMSIFGTLLIRHEPTFSRLVGIGGGREADEATAESASD